MPPSSPSAVLTPTEKSVALIDAARSLFIKKGFAKVGMREIAGLAGLNPMQAYRLGLAKEDLLAEISIQLTAEQLTTITAGFSPGPDETLQTFVERDLLQFYESDIAYISIRKESAAYGWMWSSKYESRIIEQVIAVLQPLSDAMASQGLQNIPDRGFSIWAMYYVGYRLAVIKGASANDCLNQIKNSLTLVLR